jgi:allantoin racemase
MRICYVNVNPEAASGAFIPVLEKILNPIKDEGTEIGYKFPEIGCNRAADFETSYFLLLNKAEVIKAIIEAEQEGYDAVVVGCFLDTGVQEAREMVDIPVIGINEASLSLAGQMGSKCAVVGVHEPKLNMKIEDVIRNHSFSINHTDQKVIPFDIPSIQWMKNATTDLENIASEMENSAYIGVQNGADVIVLGCAGLGPLASLAGLKMVKDTEVPILDPVTIGIKTAEFQVRLVKSLGLPPVSRGGKYKKPRVKDQERIKQIFKQ